MANNEIVAWLRLRDSIRFRRDAKRAEDAIKGISDAADDGQGPLNQFGGALSTLMGNLPDFSGRTRIFGFAIGTVITAFIAVIPLVVALGGALTALAGSLGAAALGAGALGIAVAGAAIPLGALGLVAFNAFKNFSDVNTAWQTYRRAVGAFGNNSKQAETALQRLNGRVKESGGPAILDAVKAWYDLRNAFQDATRGVLKDLVQMMIGLFKIIRMLLPTFAAIAKMASGALLKAFKSVADLLSSPSFQIALLSLGHAFERLAGPAIRTVVNFFAGLLTIAARLAPKLGWLFTGVENISIAFKNWAATGNLNGLVSQFKSWLGLLIAVGKLLFTILSAGAGQGQGLVDTLTSIVDKWNAWLNTTQGQTALRNFFRDAIALTKVFFQVTGAIIQALFRFGRAMMPIYTVALKAIIKGVHQFREALEPMSPFLNNILIPILKGLAEGTLASVVGSFKVLIFVIRVISTVLGALGKLVGPGLKPVFETLGKIIGFVFGGAILKVLSSLGKVNILLGPLAFGFRLLLLPIRLAGGAVELFFGAIAKLLGYVAMFGVTFFRPIGLAIAGVIAFLTGAGAKFYDAGFRLWTRFKEGIFKAIGSGLGFAGDIGKAIWNFIAGTFNRALPNKIHGPGPLPDLNLPDNPLPMLAGGGVVSGMGSWITGESGPELNTMIGSSVRVQPLTPSVKTHSPSATLEPGGPKRVLISKVYLRGKQIAEAVADEAEDEAARR